MVLLLRFAFVLITEDTWYQFATVVTTEAVYTYIDGIPTSRDAMTGSIYEVCEVIAAARIYGSRLQGLYDPSGR